jgi:hypothetical protein
MANVLYCPSCGAETRQQVIQRTHYSCPVCHTNTPKRNLSNTGKGLRLAGVYSEALGPTVTPLASAVLYDGTQSTDYVDTSPFTVSPTDKIIVIVGQNGAGDYPQFVDLNATDALTREVYVGGAVSTALSYYMLNTATLMPSATGANNNTVRVTWDSGIALPISAAVVVLRLDNVPQANMYESQASSTSILSSVSVTIPAVTVLPQTLIGATVNERDASQVQVTWTSQDMVAITKIGTNSGSNDTTLAVARRSMIASKSSYLMSASMSQTGIYDTVISGVTFKRG